MSLPAESHSHYPPHNNASAIMHSSYYPPSANADDHPSENKASSRPLRRKLYLRCEEYVKPSRRTNVPRMVTIDEHMNFYIEQVKERMDAMYEPAVPLPEELSLTRFKDRLKQIKTYKSYRSGETSRAEMEASHFPPPKRKYTMVNRKYNSKPELGPSKRRPKLTSYYSPDYIRTADAAASPQESLHSPEC